MRTSNPVLGDSTFTPALAGGATMTLQGAVQKTMILVGLLMVTFAYTYVYGNVLGHPLVPCLIGFGLAITITLAPTWAPTLAPVYALVEGVFLGAVSAAFEAAFPGIVLQAGLLTVTTLFGLLLAYTSGLIQATENFKLGVVAATLGVMLLYVVNLGLNAFLGASVPYLHDTGAVGIGISLVIVVIAALNLVLDFDFIESGAGVAPKYMEWYAGFGLLVTLIWLYLEFLRLLAKLRSE